MDIKTVKLTDVLDLENKPTGEKLFLIVDEDGTEVFATTSPDNRHYWEVREWYLKQKKSPFEFDFEDTPEAEAEPETDEDGSGLALTAEQSKDAKLPQTNLTREQRKEISERNNK